MPAELTSSAGKGDLRAIRSNRRKLLRTRDRAHNFSFDCPALEEFGFRARYMLVA